MLKKVFAAAACAVLVFLVGCTSTPTVEDTTYPVPEASNDPIALNAMGGDGFSALGNGAGQGAWQNPEQLNSGADADGWIPVDPQNRLNMPIIYFAYDSDVLVPSETANLDKIAAYLNQNQGLGLVIEGHCDSRGTDEYNRALGERRANAIRAYLAGKGVADNRMKTVSYGKEKPAVSGSGDSIWRKNRRGVPVPMIMPAR